MKDYIIKNDKTYFKITSCIQVQDTSGVTPDKWLGNAPRKWVTKTYSITTTGCPNPRLVMPQQGATLKQGDFVTLKTDHPRPVAEKLRDTLLNREGFIDCMQDAVTGTVYYAVNLHSDCRGLTPEAAKAAYRAHAKKYGMWVEPSLRDSEATA